MLFALSASGRCAPEEDDDEEEELWPSAPGVQASTRATFYVYNTHDEVDALADGIRYAQRFFGVSR